MHPVKRSLRLSAASKESLISTRCRQKPELRDHRASEVFQTRLKFWLWLQLGWPMRSANRSRFVNRVKILLSAPVPLNRCANRCCTSSETPWRTESNLLLIGKSCANHQTVELPFTQR